MTCSLVLKSVVPPICFMLSPWNDSSRWVFYGWKGFDRWFVPVDADWVREILVLIIKKHVRNLCFWRVKSCPVSCSMCKCGLRSMKSVTPKYQTPGPLFFPILNFLLGKSGSRGDAGGVPINILLTTHGFDKPTQCQKLSIHVKSDESESRLRLEQG